MRSKWRISIDEAILVDVSGFLSWGSHRRKSEFCERGEQLSAMELVQVHREMEKDHRSDSLQCRSGQHCLFQFPTLLSLESTMPGVKKRQSVDSCTPANPRQIPSYYLQVVRAPQVPLVAVLPERLECVKPISAPESLLVVVGKRMGGFGAWVSRPPGVRDGSVQRRRV
jgi:hypothetical protein